MRSNEIIKFNPITGDYVLEVKEEWINKYSRKRVAPFFGITEVKMVINIKKSLPTFEEVQWSERETFIENYVDFFINAATDGNHPEYVELLSRELTIGGPEWATLEEVKAHLEIDVETKVDVLSPYM